MGHVVSLCQTKGGSGKTTTALSVAAALVRLGHTAIVFDADPSRSACHIAADGRLTFPVEAHLLESIDDAKSVSAWRAKIKSSQSDFVLIDAPGHAGVAFGAALAISQLALVPSGATVLDLRGAAESIGLIRHHRKSTGQPRPDILVVPSRIDKRTSAGKDAVATLAGLTEAVSPAISYRAQVADAFASGLTVPATSESAKEYDALAQAVLTRLGVLP